ncbi:hypothetical protein GCM10007893_28790 [Paracoccus marinus]|nr:hypothetical protein GCM10007893_28790 [Paracoccus marinus]
MAELSHVGFVGVNVPFLLVLLGAGAVLIMADRTAKPLHPVGQTLRAAFLAVLFVQRLFGVSIAVDVGTLPCSFAIGTFEESIAPNLLA